MRKRNRVGEREVGKDERLTVTEWHGSAELLRSGERGVGGAEQAKANPRSIQSGERLRGAWVLSGWYFGPLGVFLAVPLYLIFYGKVEGLPSGDPRLIPHNPQSSEDQSP